MTALVLNKVKYFRDDFFNIFSDEDLEDFLGVFTVRLDKKGNKEFFIDRDRDHVSESDMKDPTEKRLFQETKKFFQEKIAGLRAKKAAEDAKTAAERREKSKEEDKARQERDKARELADRARIRANRKPMEDFLLPFMIADKLVYTPSSIEKKGPLFLNVTRDPAKQERSERLGRQILEKTDRETLEEMHSLMKSFLDDQTPEEIEEYMALPTPPLNVKSLPLEDDDDS